MANLSDKVAPSGVLTPTGDGSNLSGILTPTGDGSGLTGLPKPHGPVAVSGATPSLDVGAYNFFQQGALTADTTVSFASVPTDAKWQYSYVAGFDVSQTFDLATAVYSNKSFDASSQATSTTAASFSSDGTSMFVLDSDNNIVYQYTLSAGFDVSTASYASKSFDASSQLTTSRSVAFNTDGTSMFIIDSGGSVFQYTLSTGFDVTTTSYASKSFDVSSQDGNLASIAFNTDGTAMFVLGRSNQSVFQYTLSTGFDVTTTSYASKSFDVSSQDTNPFGIAFNPNGTSMFIVGNTTDDIFQYTLSTGFDVSTASYTGTSFDASPQDGSCLSVAFNSFGTAMFIMGTINDTVFQYTLDGEPYSLTLPTVVGTPSATTVGDRVTYTFVTDDGGTTIDLIAEEIIQ